MLLMFQNSGGIWRRQSPKPLEEHQATGLIILKHIRLTSVVTNNFLTSRENQKGERDDWVLILASPRIRVDSAQYFLVESSLKS